MTFNFWTNRLSVVPFSIFILTKEQVIVKFKPAFDVKIQSTLARGLQVVHRSVFFRSDWAEQEKEKGC